MRINYANLKMFIAQVEAEVLGEVKGPKVIFHRFRKRKNSHSRRGHRQRYTKVRIGKIAG